jgi:hypothetical protein
MLLTLFGFGAGETLAQGAGITLRPATIEERIDPGTEKQFTVMVKNESGSEQLYYLGKRDIVGVRDGSVPVFRDRSVAPTGYDMSQWINLFQDTVLVPAGGEMPIQFAIKVPQDAPPCSHFAGIFVSVEPPDLEQSGAAIGYEVANIISLRVSGECDESAQIRQFSTDNYLYGSPKVNFNIRIENDGNTLIRPTGPVEITNMFGQEVGNGLMFNESGAAVFPKDTREYNFEWVGEGYGFGRYEAVVSPVYGEEGNKKTMSSSVTFWILPMAIILPALGGLLVAFLIVYISVTLYVKRKLAYYQAVGGRRVVRRRESGSPLLLIFLVMLTVTALFFIVLLLLFA